MLIASCGGLCVLLSPSVLLVLKVSDFQIFILPAQCFLRGGASRKAESPASCIVHGPNRYQRPAWNRTEATRCWEDAGHVPGGGSVLGLLIPALEGRPCAQGQSKRAQTLEPHRRVTGDCSAL